MLWYVHILDDPNWTTNILYELFELNEEMENEEEEEHEEIRHFEDTNLIGGIKNITVSNISDTGMPGHCRSELWSCLSSLMETGIRQVKNPGDMFRWPLNNDEFVSNWLNDFFITVQRKNFYTRQFSMEEWKVCGAVSWKSRRWETLERASPTMTIVLSIPS